jgi:hypothetical protein
LEDGKIVYRYTCHGVWVKEIGGIVGHGKNVDIDGVNICTVKNRKFIKQVTVVNNGADQEYIAAVLKQAAMDAEKRKE